MSFAALLDHQVHLERRVDSGVEDDFGNPVITPEVGQTFAAAIQPRTVREVQLVAQNGVAIADTVIYCLPRVIATGDAIIHDTAACPKADAVDLPTGRYELTGVRNETGRGHHLALDARLIGAGIPAVEGS